MVALRAARTGERPHAILAFTQIRGSLDRDAASQTAAIATKLSQASQAVAGVAPALFAKGSTRPHGASSRCRSRRSSGRCRS